MSVEEFMTNAVGVVSHGCCGVRNGRQQATALVDGNKGNLPSRSRFPFFGIKQLLLESKLPPTCHAGLVDVIFTVRP